MALNVLQDRLFVFYKYHTFVKSAEENKIPTLPATSEYLNSHISIAQITMGQMKSVRAKSMFELSRSDYNQT